MYRRALNLPALVFLVTIACTSSRTAAVATPTAASAQPSATVAAASPNSPATISAAGPPPQAFLTTIATTLDAGDPGALLSLMKETEWDCRTTCPSEIVCSTDQCGKVRRGIRMGPYASEFSLVSRQDVPGTLARFFATPQAEASDQYGSGALQLYGLGTGNGQVFDAITTLIQQDDRRVILLRLDQEEGKWFITGVILVGTPFAEQVLSGSGDYRIVQRWP